MVPAVAGAAPAPAPGSKKIRPCRAAADIAVRLPGPEQSDTILRFPVPPRIGPRRQHPPDQPLSPRCQPQAADAAGDSRSPATRPGTLT